METLATIDHINECTSDRAPVVDSPSVASQRYRVYFICVFCVFLNVNPGEWSFDFPRSKQHKVPQQSG